MLPSSFVVFTAALLTSLAAATDLTCTPSVNGYGINSAKTDAEDFCSTAQRSNSSLLEKSYGLPYITFRFSKQSECGTNDCMNAYTGMFNNCQYNNKTIWGTAQTNTNCATYNYTIGNTTSPFLTPNTTLAPGASITPSPTGDANGNTAVLGTSEATMAKISGSLILGVAGIFILFL